MLKLNYFHRSPDNTWDAAATYETVEDAVKAVTGMGQHQVRSLEDEKTFLENATKTARSESAQAERKIFLDSFDSKFKELTGVERDPSAKTTDYVFKSYTDLAAKHKAQTEEYETFKTSKLSESDAAKEVKMQLDKFKLTAKAELDEANNAIATMKSAQFSYKVDASVQEAMNRIKPTLKENEYLDQVISAEIAAKFSKFKAIEHEGTIIYHGDDDKPVIDSKDGNHLSTFSILEKIFEPMVDQGRKAAGTGANTKTPGASGEVTADELRLELPAEITNKMKLMDYLPTLTFKGNKVEAGSTMFNALFEVNSVKADGSPLPLR